MFITEKDSLPYQNKFLRRCKSSLEYLAHFIKHVILIVTSLILVLIRFSFAHKIPLSLPLPFFHSQIVFSRLSNLRSLSLSLFISFRRAFTITVVVLDVSPSRTFFLSEISPSRIQNSRRCEQVLIANDCFRRAQSHLETLTALRFTAILWDKCLTWRIIKREAGSNQTVESKSRILRCSFLLSRKGHRRASFISHRSSLTIITIVVRLNIMTRRNSHSGASTMRRSDWSAMLVPSNSSRLRVDDDVDLSTIEFVITMVDVKLSLD